MFVAAPEFTHLNARPEQIVCLIESINAISVKVPGFPTGPALGTIVAWNVREGLAATVIHLYFSANNQGVAYLHEPRQFSPDQLDEVREEAIEFLESMGFMLDDTSFASLNGAQRDELVARVPVFFADLEAFASARGRGPSQPAAPSISSADEGVAGGPVLATSNPSAALTDPPASQLDSARTGGDVALEQRPNDPNGTEAVGRAGVVQSSASPERKEALGRLLMSF